MKRSRFGMKTVLVAGIVATLSGAALAETIWIKAEAVDIRAGKGAIYPVVAKAPKGQQLTVIEHDGKWIKVAIPGAVLPAATQGYVYETAISPTKVDGPNLFSNLNKGTDMSTAAAAKGLQPTAENYASTKGMSSAPLNHLIALRDRIDPREWERFKAEGHVGQ